MEWSALAGDNEEFTEYYKEAVEESRLRGDADPEKKVLDTRPKPLTLAQRGAWIGG